VPDVVGRATSCSPGAISGNTFRPLITRLFAAAPASSNLSDPVSDKLYDVNADRPSGINSG